MYTYRVFKIQNWDCNTLHVHIVHAILIGSILYYNSHWAVHCVNERLTRSFIYIAVVHARSSVTSIFSLHIIMAPTDCVWAMCTAQLGTNIICLFTSLQHHNIYLGMMVLQLKRNLFSISSRADPTRPRIGHKLVVDII